jgi:2-amino-4-hydroxy-6-hydroxymethyldihydropteridine diphosphokinase
VPYAVLGLGSNLGSRRALLACARELLAAQPGLVVLASSPLYHTPPLGPPQPEYLNAALKVSWPGSARALLQLTQHIEQLLLRRRDHHWGPRTLDIDLLYWSAGDVAEPGLTVPHPGLVQRLFALVPLLDVAPELAPRFARGLLPDARAFAPMEPFEPRFSATSERVLSAFCDDALELLATLPGALSALAPADSCASGVLPFCIPIRAHPLGLSELEGPLSELAFRVRAAHASGFRVQAAAITEVGQGRCRGVFVGAHDALARPLPSLSYVLTEGSRGIAISVQRT